VKRQDVDLQAERKTKGNMKTLVVDSRRSSLEGFLSIVPSVTREDLS